MRLSDLFNGEYLLAHINEAKQIAEKVNYDEKYAQIYREIFIDKFVHNNIMDTETGLYDIIDTFYSNAYSPDELFNDYDEFQMEQLTNLWYSASGGRMKLAEALSSKVQLPYYNPFDPDDVIDELNTENWKIKWNQFKHIINKDWGYTFDDEDMYKKMLIELYVSTQIHGDKNTTGSRFSVIYLDEFENLTEHFKNIINQLFKNFKLLYRASIEFKKLYKKYKNVFNKHLDKDFYWILGEIEYSIENKFNENFNQMATDVIQKEFDFNYPEFQQELANYLYSHSRIDQLISGEFLQ